MSSQGEEIDILYTNRRGETRWRRVLPVAWIFDVSKYHEGFQHILVAKDAEKGYALRDFAVNNILCIGRGNMQRLLDAPLKVWDDAGVQNVGTVPTNWTPDEILKREG